MQKLTAADPETKSPDIKTENLTKLRALFPELVSEGSDGLTVNVDVLKQLVGDQTVTDADEKYGLNWHGKRRARQLALTPSTGTLRPCPEDSMDWDTTQNLMIEGDNLEVLKLLQKSYAGNVKLIYIDPPYNTGNQFIYPDNFQDNIKNYFELTGQTGEGGRKLSSNTEASGRFHTDWPNMMYPRLQLARNLLCDEGVLIVSIDDNEVANLRRLCDEVFGEENYQATFVIRSTPNARTYGHVGKMHDYCIMYSRASESTETFELEEEGKDFKYEDEKGPFNIHPLYNSDESFHLTNRPNLYYPFYLDGTDCDAEGFYRISVDKTASTDTQVFPPKSKNKVQFVWRWGKEKARQNTNIEIVGYKTENGEYRIVRKMRHTSRTVCSMLLDKQYSGRHGTSEVETLFGRKVFSFPKPLALLETLLDVTTEGDDIILDFFAGSGTTAHAAMNLNVRDGSNRRFILVQLPEPVAHGDNTAPHQHETIADVAKERLRRAAKKIREENPMFAGDLGFRVFKLDSSNIRAWEADREKLAETLEASIEHLKTDRTEQDILFELLLKLGLDLCVPIERKKVAGGANQAHEIHSIGGGSLLVCLSPAIPHADLEPLALGLVAWHQALKPAGETTVVFRDSAFADDVAKTNLTAILNQHGLETVRSL
ncbi:MAG TPA: site-specific DNA-methyltransferase [Woeseiaceae bacterium]|nr:site-specific DNA-methyltransferase [Woeseiaceae bacterium]